MHDSDDTPEGQAGDRRLLATGAIGTAVTALCCFTPVLVIGLGAVGLSAVLGWVDYVLLPALVAFIGLTIYAMARRRRRLCTTKREMTQ